MGSPEIKELFYKTRFVGGWNLVGVLLYAPLGLLLALLRVFMSLQAYLIALVLLLPDLLFVRKFVLRIMSCVLGIFVIEENISQRDKNVQVLVANHLTFLDHIPVHLLTGCISPSKWDIWPLCLKVFEGSQDKHMFASSLRTHIHSSGVPLLLHPEESTTNGKVGLLRFCGWCATIAPRVQPVCVRVWRPLGITPCTLTASFSTDLFWFLFSPVTVFTIRYLPVIQRQENESDEEMADRIADSIAKQLGVVKTTFSAKDKHEYARSWVKRRSAGAPASARTNYEEIQRMASQVSEVLPYVPVETIVRDLSRTQSVDLTISNILEGATKYSPITPAQRTGTNRTDVSNSFSSDASCSFPRSAQERMMSFVERKTRLIEGARRRYMKKHGLATPEVTTGERS